MRTPATRFEDLLVWGRAEGRGQKSEVGDQKQTTKQFAAFRRTRGSSGGKAGGRRQNGCGLKSRVPSSHSDFWILSSDFWPPTSDFSFLASVF